MRERLIRVLLLGGAVLAVVVIATALAGSQTSVLSNLPIGEKVENLSEEVLDKVIGVLPGAPEMEETFKEEGQVAGDSDESEPIKEPVENVQKQTEILIQTIKELPQDQVEAIKKQIYKEICEGLLEEE